MNFKTFKQLTVSFLNNDLNQVPSGYAVYSVSELDININHLIFKKAEKSQYKNVGTNDYLQTEILHLSNGETICVLRENEILETRNGWLRGIVGRKKIL